MQTSHAPHTARKTLNKHPKISIHNLLYTPMPTKFVFQGRPQEGNNMKTHHIPRTST
jgi:hypothetical protein